jgi:hypothetical protein
MDDKEAQDATFGFGYHSNLQLSEVCPFGGKLSPSAVHA